MEISARNLLLAGLLAVCAWAAYTADDAAPDAPVPVNPEPSPCPGPGPCPLPKPKPKPKPWGLAGVPVGIQVLGAKVGGPISPAGVEIQCDLPESQHCSNITSKGQGCCVQTSINHSARWQNVPALINFHEWVREKGLPGGAWPGAVDDRIPKCCQDRGYPVAPYLQVEGPAAEVVPLLKLALRTGRMPAVTYSKSPTGRYGGQKIAHMVSMPHGDEAHVAILDNNDIGSQNYEWMTWDEFTRICNGGGSIWAVVLLAPGPSPVPRN